MHQMLTWGSDDVLATIEAHAYRGPDRRTAGGVRAARSRPGSISVAACLVGTNVVVLAVALAGSATYSVRTGSSDWLTACVAVVAALAGAIELMKWRLVGDAPALWIGGALLIYSAVNIAFPGLLRSLGGSDVQSWDDLVRPASVFVVIVLLAVAPMTPTIDAALRPRRVAITSGAAGIIGLLASSVSPTLRLLLGPPIDRAAVDHAAAFGQIGVGLLWVSLGVVYLFRTWDDDGAKPWVGVMLLGLAEARLGLALSVDGNASWLLASQLFRLFGMIAMLAGTVHGLHLAFAKQRAHLLDSLIELSSTRAQQRAEHASAEDRAHDLKAALVGIGSAAVTLERYHEQISDDERASLTSALSAEIARLQHFVAAARDEPAPFTVAQVLEPVLTCAAAQGMQLDLRVDDALTAVGRPAEVAEVVQNLLDNARAHAGTAVTVRAERRGQRAVIRVEDRGPGVPVVDRRRVFERGWRGGASRGSGLGLHVASRLAQNQDGELWVEDRAGGGAAFVLSLPAAGREELR